MAVKKSTKKKAPKAKSTLRIQCTNKKLLEAAITHPSYRNENPGTKLEDFDRLEFFGDSVLNLVVCRKLYKLYPDADEGMLSRLRSILVSKKVLCKVSKKLELHKHIRVGYGLEKQGNFSNGKIISDCFEAIIAALYFDRGFDRAERFVLTHLKPYFDSRKLFRLDPNPKSTLQELVLKKWKRLPDYTSKTTPKGTTTSIAVNTRLKAKAEGKTKKESEEKAARLLIQRIRERSTSSRSLRSKRERSGKKLRKTL